MWFCIFDDVVIDVFDVGIDFCVGVYVVSYVLFNAFFLSVLCGDVDVGCECFFVDLY